MKRTGRTKAVQSGSTVLLQGKTFKIPQDHIPGVQKPIVEHYKGEGATMQVDD
jgi:hypothetical protein